MITWQFRLITRSGCERVFDYAFRLSAQRRKRGRPGNVTCVDKAGVLKSYAYMRRIFEERSRDFSEFRPDCANIDATALNLLLKPWDFDVIVTDDGTVAITRAVLAEVAKA